MEMHFNTLQIKSSIIILLFILAGCQKDNAGIAPDPTLSDAQAVKTDANNLSVKFSVNDNQRNVTGSLALPLTGPNGTTISWVSDNPSVISPDGTVTRPTFNSGNAAVTLTATIKRGTETQQATYTMTVLEAPQSDTQAVAADKTNLLIGYNGGDSAAGVTQNLTLPLSGSSGTTISWSSDNSAVITSNGTVNRPGFINGDATVTLTAKIKKGVVFDTKVFVITVLKSPANSCALDLEKIDLCTL